jgi:hypothetical protein
VHIWPSAWQADQRTCIGELGASFMQQRQQQQQQSLLLQVGAHLAQRLAH